MWYVAYHSLGVDVLVDGVVVDVEGGGDDGQLGGHDVNVAIAEELAREAGHGHALRLHLGVVQRKLVVLVDLRHAAEGVPASMPDEQVLQVTCNGTKKIVSWSESLHRQPAWTSRSADLKPHLLMMLMLDGWRAREP